MKVQEVREPGTFTKRMIQTTMGLVVAGDDCGTGRGIAMNIGDNNVYDRRLAADVSAKGTKFSAGTLMTPQVVDRLKAADKSTTVVVRSPLKCEHSKGLCKKCAGLRPNGEEYPMGTNLGIIASQALGERSVQLTMKAFHCLHEHSLVLLKEGDKVYHATLSELCGRESLGDVFIWDQLGWVAVMSTDSHVQQPGTAMAFVRTRSGFGSVSQDNHPHMLRENMAVCPECGTYPKQENGGRQYRCRKCTRKWEGAPVDDAETLMVPPHDTQRKSHRATLDRASPDVTHMDEPINSGWLAGIYCAEGCVNTRDNNGKPYRVGLYISQLDTSPVYSRIGDELAELTGKRGARPCGHQIYSIYYAQMFHELFGYGARNKGLPSGWSGYAHDWLASFVSGIIDGDGAIQECTDSHWKRCNIDTTSYLLAQQVHWVLRSRGIQARVVLTPWRKASLHQGIRVEFVITEKAKEVLCDSDKIAGVQPKPLAHEERFDDVVDYIKEFRFASPPVVYDIQTASGTFFVDGMLTHNSGGVVQAAGTTTGAVNDFERVKQLTDLNETIPNSATIAMKAGKIDKIERDRTGTAVWVGGVRHHVGKDRRGASLIDNLPHATKRAGYKPWRPPKMGMRVRAGETLSDPNRTNINPRDLYRATNDMETVQNFLVGELSSIYGRDVRRQHVETVVRAMGDLTKIRDPGDATDVVRGEFQSASNLRARNRDLVKRGLKPVEHSPVLKGVDNMPLAIQEDWMAKLQHIYLKKTLLEAASMGAVSNIHGTHPVPGIAYGAEFGRTSKEALKPGFKHLQDVPGYAY